MLESAINKLSSSVVLDLLTYEDLEAMWEKKLGTAKKGKRDSNPQAKRYLILTYSVEFDRIHYPLALSYCGYPDPVALQDIIRNLRAELDSARKQISGTSTLAHLQKENSVLAHEKQQLQEELLSCKHHLNVGNSTKDIKILKRVIKNLEEEVLREHSKYQKYMNKKNEEIKDLLKQIKTLQSAKKQLQNKVKSLTLELTDLKRGYRTPSVSRMSRPRRNSTERRNSDPGSRVYSNKLNTGSKEKTQHRNFQTRTRTPSPFQLRVPRFDPTAYIEGKRRRQVEIKQKVEVKSRPLTNSGEKVLSKRMRRQRECKGYISSKDNSSCYSSCHSSAGSICGDEVLDSRSEKEAKGKSKLALNEPDLYQKTEMSEIDMRLNALQAFMKRSLESAKSYSRS